MKKLHISIDWVLVGVGLSYLAVAFVAHSSIVKMILAAVALILVTAGGVELRRDMRKGDKNADVEK